MVPNQAETLRSYLKRAPAIPVVAIDDARSSIGLVQTLLQAGLPVIEVTLRSPAALDAISAIVKALPDAVVAADTVPDKGQIAEAIDAGANFLVTPGTPQGSRRASWRLPMPGCATVSEAMALSDLDFEILKYFPASAAGGAVWLASLLGSLPHLSFCPTGGIDRKSAPTYLSLPNVACVDGAWGAPAELMRHRDFAAIGGRAAEAAALERWS